MRYKVQFCQPLIHRQINPRVYEAWFEDRDAATLVYNALCLKYAEVILILDPDGLAQEPEVLFRKEG